MKKGFIVTLLLIFAFLIYEVHTISIDVTSYNKPKPDGSVDISPVSIISIYYVNIYRKILYFLYFFII